MDFTETFLTFLISTITGVVTFFIGHKKAKAELETTMLANIERSVTIYQTIINDMKDEIVYLNKKIDELEVKVDALLKENETLKSMLKR